MPTAKPTAPRKRNRERKRRLASSPSSSSSGCSDSSSDEISTKPPVRKAPLKKQATPSSVEESSSPSPSSSDSENDNVPSADAPVAPPPPSAKPPPPGSELAIALRRSPSSSPPPADATPVPTSRGPGGSSNRAHCRTSRLCGTGFRQFWMASVADVFGDGLEQIRKVRYSPVQYLQNKDKVLPRSLTLVPKEPDYDQIAPSSANRLACFWRPKSFRPTWVRMRD